MSLLDLATIGPGDSAADSFSASVKLAQTAEGSGIARVWYAEHHNMPAIASSATSVLIAHIAAHTQQIRLGAGGVMLPNHSPLVIAEQFGTLASLHPNRIDLGVGRAPGTDQRTMYALRRDGRSSDRFPEDVRELQGYLTDDPTVPGVAAIPGAGTNVPIYILGSSLFGAKLAAAFGLPYAFASHFAPGALTQAVSIYRDEFQPSKQLDTPYVIATMNAIVDSSASAAQGRFDKARKHRARRMITGGDKLSEKELDAVLTSPAGQQLQEMWKYSAVGEPGTVADEVERFAVHARCDEVMLVLRDLEPDPRIEGLRMLAEARG